MGCNLPKARVNPPRKSLLPNSHTNHISHTKFNQCHFHILVVHTYVEIFLLGEVFPLNLQTHDGKIPNSLRKKIQIPLGCGYKGLVFCRNNG